MRSVSGVQHVPSPNLHRRRIFGARVNIFVLGRHLGIGYRGGLGPEIIQVQSELA